MIYTSSDSTYILAKKAFTLARKSNSKVQQTKVLNLLGGYFQIKADYLQAIDYYQKSLKIGEEMNNIDAILVATGNIGALYILLGQNKKGLEYQLKSLALAEKGGMRSKLGSIYNNLSLVYFNFKELNKSVEYGLKSLENYREFDDKNGICSATGNLGNAYTGLKEYDKALSNFMICHELATEISNTYEQSKSALDIGDIYLEKKNYKEALRFFSEAKTVAEENDDDVNTKDAYLGLYKAYKSLGDTKKSLECYEKFHEYNNEINKEEKEEAVNRKEMEFEFNKRTVRDSIRNAEERKVQNVILSANKAQIQKDRILKIVLTVGLILVIAFGILIFNRFRITRKQKFIIELKNKQTEEQKAIIENKNKEILDSINYAKRIQYTLLAHDEFLKENLPEHFVLFRPKDIVSGDYYWAVKKDHLFYLACCDSTGHGVPGAFMSLLNIGFISEAINEKNILEPHKVFNYVRERLINSISKEEQKDGFDGILMCFNKMTGKISYVAANNAPLLISDKRAIELPYDKMPVGKGETESSFTLHEIDVKTTDTIYLFTDGYADQFGGPKGKKFKYKQLEDLLVSCSELSISDQKDRLDREFLDWKGNLEQIDDVCVIGIRF
jgi:serine phosphatase RsbU (regulator of sigma subunit)